MLGALALGRWEKLVKSWVVFGIWAREKGGGNSWLYIGFFFLWLGHGARPDFVCNVTGEVLRRGYQTGVTWANMARSPSLMW